MWKINDRDIIHFGRSPGGDQFTELLDACIRAQAFVCGIPDSEIRTNLSTTIQDGGVDTQVCKPVSEDPTGWLKDSQTIWQYKATVLSNIIDKKYKLKKLEKEVNKSHAKECIKKGYAYRLCVCDNIVSEQKETIEKSLNSIIRKINTDAPLGKVLAVSDIAVWVNRYPALVLSYFRFDLPVLHLKAWGNNITTVTPKFVPVPEWQDIMNGIKQHVDFSKKTTDVVFSISGEAGVGKTRMVYESLNSIPQATALTVYTSDDQSAYNLAIMLANNFELQAIVVVDECDVVLRERLRDLLRGAKNRVRIITIDNSGERLRSHMPEIWLEKIHPNIVETILAENYPDVSEERRHIYSDLAGGFVRLAADLCQNDKSIVKSGTVTSAFRNICDYLHRRLNSEELSVLEALSLFSKVGMKGDVSNQLNDLCKLIHMEDQNFREIANRLHDTCGFIGRGGRFYYVTPEIIAQIAFDFAWNHWAGELEEFLSKTPSSLLENFLKRASKSAKEEVRHIVGNFFRKWANTLTGTDLASVEKTKRLVTLVEVEPQTYLPIVYKIIDKSSQKQLISIEGYSIGARWGPRRLLVWLIERIVGFPEYFPTAEKILLKLALAESEPHIGNNATGIWKQLFRISLSGTATPFSGRLQLLSDRIFSNNSKISHLAIETLDSVFHSMFAGRLVYGPSIIAGRIPPKKWNPKTKQEYAECAGQAITLLQKMVSSTDSSLQQMAGEVIIKHARNLLALGFLKEIKSILDKFCLDDKMWLQLIEKVGNFLRFDCDTQLASKARYIDEVKRWFERFISADFHGKMLTVVGVGSWHFLTLEDESKWKSELHSLATECIKNPNKLENEIEWLCSPTAKETMALGDEIGKIDKDGALLDMMFKSAINSKCSRFAAGYIQGLLESSPQQIKRVNKWLDKVQTKNPNLAYDLCMVGGRPTKAFERVLKLIDDRKLPVTHLRGFTFGIHRTSLTQEEFEKILKRLIIPTKGSNKLSRKIAIEFIAYGLADKTKQKTIDFLERKRIRSLAWRLMKITAKDGGGNPHWWAEILELLSNYDVDKAAHLSSRGLVSKNYEHKKMCEKSLGALAHKSPDIVMERIGEVILDKKLGWHFYINSYRSLICSLPESTIINWVRKHGVEAARRIARHLPKPHLSSDGKPIVPPLTEFILTEYEDDERAFHEFCAGIHALETYSGNIAARHEEEAEIAKKFFGHPLRRISEWAQIEYDDAKREAKQWREYRQEWELE